MGNALKDGAMAGLVATVPMTAAMAVMHRFPQKDPKPLPPEQVARTIAKKLDFDHKMDRTEKQSYVWLSHFGYGAATGALFPLLMKQKEKHAISKGVAFGLGVWATSYMGWLPALRITPPVDREPKQHVALEVVAHIVWGAVLGALTQRIHVKS